MKKIILYLFLFNSLPLFAQHYPINVYTTREGLAQMQVVNVLEDHQGYIWAVTKGGLSKFDGEKFENFYRQDSLLYDRFVEYIYEDSKNNIWVNYRNRGFARFDGATFENYVLPFSQYSNIVEWKGKMVFLKNDTLWTIENKKAIPTKIVSHLSGSGQLIVDKKTSIFYLLNDSNIYFYDEKIKDFRQILITKNQELTYSCVGNEVLLFATSNENRSLSVYSLHQQQLVKILYQTPTAVQYFSYLDLDFIYPYESQTWLYDAKLKKTVAIDNSISHATINLPNRNKGRVYYGTEKGLRCVFTNGFQYFTENEVPYAWGVTEDNNKNIWIANFGYPLQKYHAGTLETIRDYEIPVLRKLQNRDIILSTNAINSWYFHPLKDKFGKLWFPDYVGVLIRDANDIDYISYRSKDNLKKASFFYITEDVKRNKILGCGYEGVSIIDNKKPYTSTFLTDSTEMFKGRNILSAVVAPNGDYWLGRKCIARYNPATKKLVYYDKLNKKLPAEGIGNLVYDTHGGLWVGTFADGLLHYDTKNDKFDYVFHSYFKDQATYFIGQMTDKYLMVGDNLNIYIIDLDVFYKNHQEKVVKVLNQHNGFMGLEPAQCGFFKDSDGKIWIGSGSVLSVLNPKGLNLAEQNLQTVIRKINGKRVPFNYEKGNIISLPYGINDVKIEVESIGEDKSFKSAYSYRIKGFREEWSAWQAESSILLTNLPNGEYQIEVRSQRGKIDANNHPITRLSFEVDIPFYKSPNFYKYASLHGLLFLGFISLLWYKNWRQKKELVRQIAFIREQEHKVKFLQVQTTQAQMNPHFIFNVLESMQYLILNNRNADANDNLVRLSHLIRSYLDASLLEEDSQQSLFSMEITLTEEMQLLKMYIEFEKLQKDRFDYVIELDAKIDPENFKIPPLMIQPFVENAIKHGLQETSTKGHLWIRFKEADEALICIIEDDGIGREKAEKLQQNSIKKYKSVGSKLVQKRVDILNQMGYDISLNITDRANGGTIVTLKIDYQS